MAIPDAFPWGAFWEHLLRTYVPPGLGLIWFLYFQPLDPTSNVYAGRDNCCLLKLEAVMLDAIFLGAGLAFFAAAIGYTLLCEKL